MTLPEVMAGEVAHKGKSRRTRGRVSPGESPKRGVAYKDACPYLYTPPPPPFFAPDESPITRRHGSARVVRCQGRRRHRDALLNAQQTCPWRTRAHRIPSTTLVQACAGGPIVLAMALSDVQARQMRALSGSWSRHSPCAPSHRITTISVPCIPSPSLSRRLLHGRSTAGCCCCCCCCCGAAMFCAHWPMAAQLFLHAPGGLCTS